MTGNLLPTLRKFSFVSPSLVNIIELGLRKRRGGHARTRHHFLVESKTACSQRRLCSASPIFHFSSFILQYVLKSSFKCLETPESRQNKFERRGELHLEKGLVLGSAAASRQEEDGIEERG